jgi:hypothetical protein
MFYFLCYVLFYVHHVVVILEFLFKNFPVYRKQSDPVF